MPSATVPGAMLTERYKWFSVCTCVTGSPAIARTAYSLSSCMALCFAQVLSLKTPLKQGADRLLAPGTGVFCPLKGMAACPWQLAMAVNGMMQCPPEEEEEGQREEEESGHLAQVHLYEVSASRAPCNQSLSAMCMRQVCFCNLFADSCTTPEPITCLIQQDTVDYHVCGPAYSVVYTQ